MNACAMVSACLERQTGPEANLYELQMGPSVETVAWENDHLPPSDTGRIDVIRIPPEVYTP